MQPTNQNPNTDNDSDKTIAVNYGIDNKELLTAITHLKESGTSINLQMLIQALWKAKIITAIQITNGSYKFEPNKGVVLSKDASISYTLLSKPNGEIYCPIFSSKEEFAKSTFKKDGAIVQNFRHTAQNILKENKIKGIVLDPFGCNMTLEKNLLTQASTPNMPEINTSCCAPNLQNTVHAEEEKMLIGTPSTTPDKMIKNVTHLLKEYKVKNAWLRMVEEKNTVTQESKKYYLVIVEGAVNSEELLHKLTDSSAQNETQYPVNFTASEHTSPSIIKAIKDVKPFYTKKKFLSIF